MNALYCRRPRLALGKYVTQSAKKIIRVKRIWYVASATQWALVLLLLFLMVINTHATTICASTIDEINSILAARESECKASYDGTGATFESSLPDYSQNCTVMGSDGIIITQAGYRVNYGCNGCSATQVKEEITSFQQECAVQCKKSDYACVHSQFQWGISLTQKVCGSKDESLSKLLSLRREHHSQIPKRSCNRNGISRFPAFDN